MVTAPSRDWTKILASWCHLLTTMGLDSGRTWVALYMLSYGRKSFKGACRTSRIFEKH